MLRSPTTHIVEIGTSTTKTTPTLLQKLHHANSCCTTNTITTKYNNCDKQQQIQQQQQQQQEQNNYLLKNHLLNQELKEQNGKVKQQAIRSRSIRSTCRPTVIKSSPLLTLKENLTARSLLLFAPFAFMRSKKSKTQDTAQDLTLLSAATSSSLSSSTLSLSTKSEPVDVLTNTQTIINSVDALNGYGYDTKLPFSNVVDCKSLMVSSNNNNICNSCKNSSSNGNINLNNNNNNNNINNYNKGSEFIYKTTGKFSAHGKKSLQAVVVDSDGGIDDIDSLTQTQCSCIEQNINREKNNKNNYNYDKANNSFNKNSIKFTNCKEICCNNCNRYNKNSVCSINHTTAATTKFKSSSTKSAITSEASEASASSPAPAPAPPSTSTSSEIITSSVLSVVSYSAIVASPTVVTIALLSPTIATITTTNTTNSKIATAMSPTSQTPPSSRTSLFDSCHRKIRLIGGGPVAFLGGLVAKARRKERDGDQNSTDTKLYLEESVLERKLPEADLKALVDLPAGLDYNEWLASHTLALFEHVNLVYGTISEFCTPTGCADMTGPGNRTYLWFDEKGKKTRVAAPQYIDYVMTFTQKTVSDESIFPTKYANEFPSSFESIARKILRLQFHVIAHLYATHFREIALLGLHTHLNLTFAHLTALHRRFNLIDEKETDVLRDLEVALRLTDDGNSTVGPNDSNETAASTTTITTTVTVTGNGIGGGDLGSKQTIMMDDVNSKVQCNNINDSNQLSMPIPICSQPEITNKLQQQQHQQQFRNIGLMGGILGDLSTNELNYCTSSSSVPATTTTTSFSSSTASAINNLSSITTACSAGYATDTIGFNSDVAPLHNNFNYNTNKNNTNNNNNINNNNNNNNNHNQYHNYHQHPHHNLIHHVHTHHHNHYTPNSGLIQCNATNAPNAVNNTTSTTTA